MHAGSGWCELQKQNGRQPEVEVRSAKTLGRINSMNLQLLHAQWC